MKFGNDVNVADHRIPKEKQRVAQAGLFFPKPAGHVGEDSPASNIGGVHESWRARIGIHGRAVADNQKRAGGAGDHGTDEN